MQKGIKLQRKTYYCRSMKRNRNPQLPELWCRWTKVEAFSSEEAAIDYTKKQRKAKTCRISKGSIFIENHYEVIWACPESGYWAWNSVQTSSDPKYNSALEKWVISSINKLHKILNKA